MPNFLAPTKPCLTRRFNVLFWHFYFKVICTFLDYMFVTLEVLLQYEFVNMATENHLFVIAMQIVMISKA